MQEHAPPLPRKVERKPQLVLVRHDTNSALGIGVCIWVGCGNGSRLGQTPAIDILQQGFCGFPRQVGSDVEEAVFGGSRYIGQPVCRYADGQEFGFGQLGEKAGR